jgi:hypothetical protein
MRTRLKNLRAAVSVAVLAASGAVLFATPAGPATATGDKLTGIEHVEYSTGPFDTTAPKEATVDCPPTKYVVGTGFTIGHGNGAGNVRIERVIPSAHSVTVRANVDEDGPPTTSWNLTARAVCANRPPGWQIVEVVSSSSSNYKTGVADCPEVNGVQKVAIGAGFALPDTTGQLALTALRPTTDSVSATVYEDDTGYGSYWTVTTYAICSYELDGLGIVTRNIDYGVGSQIEQPWCSATKVAIGAGGYFDGGDGNVFLTSLNSYRLPQFNNASGSTAVGVVDDNGTSLGYNMTGVALCVST